MVKQMLAVIGVVAALSAAPQPAGAVMIVNLGEQITNVTFSVALAAPWVTSGTVNTRANGNAINTSTGNLGFNTFFVAGDGTFAVLGDTSGAIGTPNDGTHELSQVFNLPTVVTGKNVISYELTISFKGVFDGKDNVSNHDVFSVLFDGSALSPTFPRDSSPLPECGPASGTGTGSCTNSQITYNPFSTTFTLTPGTGNHTLLFRLSELNGNSTDTAVGLDNISVTAKATVPDDQQGGGGGNPAIPEPGTMALFGLGALGGSLSRRRKARVA